MYFCEIENFAYGEINERSFSNPHPSIQEQHWMLFHAMLCQNGEMALKVMVHD